MLNGVYYQLSGRVGTICYCDVQGLNKYIFSNEQQVKCFLSYFLIVTILCSYKTCCPYTRRALKASRPMYGAVTSFLHSLIIQNEPRFAMFGPGLEELNTSLVLSLMSSEELSPTAGLPHRQIDGNFHDNI